MPVPRRLVERLDELLLDAYDHNSLARLLQLTFGVKLNHVAPVRATLAAVSLAVVNWGEGERRLSELAAAVAADRSQRTDAAELSKEIAAAVGGTAGEGGPRRRPGPGWRWVSTLESSHRGEV